jgi:hypothetical protein
LLQCGGKLAIGGSRHDVRNSGAIVQEGMEAQPLSTFCS